VRTWFAWIGLVHAAATVVVPILHRTADGDRIAVRDHVHIIAGATWFAALTIRTKNWRIIHKKG